MVFDRVLPAVPRARAAAIVRHGVRWYFDCAACPGHREGVPLAVAAVYELAVGATTIPASV